MSTAQKYSPRLSSGNAANVTNQDISRSDINVDDLSPTARRNQIEAQTLKDSVFQIKRLCQAQETQQKVLQDSEFTSKKRDFKLQIRKKLKLGENHGKNQTNERYDSKKLLREMKMKTNLNSSRTQPVPQRAVQ